VKRSLLDTDILSYALNRRYPEVDQVARQYLRVFRFFSVSSATIAEVVRGFQKVGDHASVREFLRDVEDFEVYPVGLTEAILAGEIMGSLERAGMTIGKEDPYIAATAIANGFELVTNNTRHYERIVELGYPLELGNWRQG